MNHQTGQVGFYISDYQNNLTPSNQLAPNDPRIKNLCAGVLDVYTTEWEGSNQIVQLKNPEPDKALEWVPHFDIIIPLQLFTALSGTEDPLASGHPVQVVLDGDNNIIQIVPNPDWIHPDDDPLAENIFKILDWSPIFTLP